MDQNRLIKISLAISGISLLVAVGAILFAVSARGQGAPQLKQVAIPEPKALTADNPASKLPHAEGMRPVGGTVKSASGSEIILTTSNGEQTIAISPATKLYRQGKQKDAAAYQKEMQAFQDTLKSAMGATEIFVSPTPYETTEASLSEFKSGIQAMALVGDDGTAVQVTVLKSSGPQR